MKKKTNTFQVENVELEKEKFYKEVRKIRKEIPVKYNKVLLLNTLLDSNTDLSVSITTRGDGKSYNYLRALIKLAEKFPWFKITLLGRHYTIRQSYEQLVEKIVFETGYAPSDFFIKSMPHYSLAYLKGSPIMLITDLNHASDLKLESNILADYRIIVYDEFLAIGDDYLINESIKLKTIFESIQRGDYPMIPTPKIVLLGNPVNFDSPLLSYWGLMDMMEHQQINTIKHHTRYDKAGNYLFGVQMERWRNDNINEHKQKGLFTDDEGSISGEFKINKALIASDTEKEAIKYDTTIKIDDLTYMIIHFNDSKHFYIQIDGITRSEYDYCLRLSDVNGEATLIKQEELNPKFAIYYEKELIKFADTFSLNYVDRQKELQYINIYRVISLETQHKRAGVYDDVKHNQRKYKLSHEGALKHRFLNEYLGGY